MSFFSIITFISILLSSLVIISHYSMYRHRPPLPKIKKKSTYKKYTREPIKMTTKGPINVSIDNAYASRIKETGEDDSLQTLVQMALRRSNSLHFSSLESSNIPIVETRDTGKRNIRQKSHSIPNNTSALQEKSKRTEIPQNIYQSKIVPTKASIDYKSEALKSYNQDSEKNSKITYQTDTCSDQDHLNSSDRQESFKLSGNDEVILPKDYRISDLNSKMITEPWKRNIRSKVIKEQHFYSPFNSGLSINLRNESNSEHETSCPDLFLKERD